MALETLSYEAFVLNSVVALAIGGLIGLERQSASVSRIIGVRTLALSAWLGFLISTGGGAFQEPLLPVTGLIGAFGLAFAHYLQRARYDRNAGVTTSLTLPLTYILGALLGVGYAFEAGASAVLMTFILAEKGTVNKWVSRISRIEIIDFLILCISAFIIYPLLPAQPLSVLGVPFDTRWFWTLVVLVSVMSFGGHVLTRLLQKHGAVPAAFFGGFLSSTAVVAWFTRDKRTTPDVLRLNLEASQAGSLVSDTIVLAAVSLPLLIDLAPTLAAIFVVLGVLTWRDARKLDGKTLGWDKPLSLAFAIEFAVVLAAVTLLIKTASGLDPVLGTFASSFVGGLLSVTSVFVAVGQLHVAGGIDTFTAVLSLWLAILGSLLVKLALAAQRFRQSWTAVSDPVFLTLAASLLGLVAQWILGGFV